MKIKITLKDPDGFCDAIRDAARESVNAISGISEDEAEELEDSRHEEISASLAKWVEYGEYVRIEFDTEAKTATVLPVK